MSASSWAARHTRRSTSPSSAVATTSSRVSSSPRRRLCSWRTVISPRTSHLLPKGLPDLATPSGGLSRPTWSACVLVAAAAVLPALEEGRADDEEDGGEVEQPGEPVAGVGEDERGAHDCAAAERSHRPRLVKQTMTASIQYWDRVA